jgi:hypothetical protein
MKALVLFGLALLVAVAAVSLADQPVTARPAQQATPPPTGTPFVLDGRLGPYVQVADACSYYPLTLCDGQEIQVSEQRAGLLGSWVRRDVHLVLVTAECGRGIAGQPLYGPVALSASAASVICPTATPPGQPPPPNPEVCPFIQNRVPAVVIQAAMANPAMVRGWHERCNPSAPPNPSNGLRGSLSVLNIGVPFHPTFNPVVWKCGCP